MKISIPHCLRLEHDELREHFKLLIKEPGEIGHLARDIAHQMEPHFVKEEAFALPPLSMLVGLSRGEQIPQADAVLAKTEKLRAELPVLHEEHRVFVRLLEKLLVVTRDSGRADYAEFVYNLILHAKIEEEIMYPAALLVGDFLRMRETV